MDKKILGILQIVFAIGMMVAVLYFSKDIEKLQVYSYIGAFLISMLSSATLFFPAPGWAVIIVMSSVLNPFYLGIVAGVGSAIGELTGYVAGDGARDILNKNIKETKKIEEIVKKYDLVAIFFFALNPLIPFDIAGIVAGGLKILWWRYLIACAAGKILKYVLLAMFGKFTLDLI